MNDFIFITFFRFIFEFYKVLILQNFPAKKFFWSNLADSRVRVYIFWKIWSFTWNYEIFALQFDILIWKYIWRMNFIISLQLKIQKFKFNKISTFGSSYSIFIGAKNPKRAKFRVGHGHWKLSRKFPLYRNINLKC